MEAASVASTQTPENPSEPTRSHRPRGPRRGRANGRGNASLSFRPSSVAPSTNTSADPSSAEHSGAEGPQRSRGGNKARGGRNAPARTVNGRHFGGQLTSSIHVDGGVPLQADAAVFVPGQATSRGNTNQRTAPVRPQKRRLSKSQAPDIATRTHEDIDNGFYECPICTAEVQRKSKVWSCHTCWTVFHLSCIKKWSTNEGSAAAQQRAENGEVSGPRQWRCPGCNLPKDDLPSQYACWCEKEIEPRAPSGIPPHSCGQTCSKERARKCPHRCELTCHAGPCPPCGHMGPTLMCFCGKHEVTKRCSETDYDTGWSCGDVCGEIMPCGEHACPRPCHEGLCGACEVRVHARCYCGQVEKEIICAEKGDECQSQTVHTTDAGEQITEDWVGLFDCERTCDRSFDCGIHHCQKTCHPQDHQPGHCPRSPDSVTNCACGKTPLTDLIDHPRTSCEDPIPSCDRPCEKTLPCGHACREICHTGNCPSCRIVIDIKCRCGRVTSKSICHQGTTEPPQCARMCRTTFNCGRHACDERCCPGERKAAERQNTKRKSRPLHSAAPRALDDGFEAEHICTRECGRLLKCGIHADTDLCHKGPCGTCREAIFSELSCHCGRTVLQPPLPCGTRPPPCRYPCNRSKACGHPQVAHNCHQDDEACPKCPFLMEKRCMCGKKTMKNQQCWLPDVRCGEICGKKLKCGSHFCTKTCHRSGECEDAHGHCTQPCGKPKKACGHPDELPCHAPYPCKEDKPCQSKIFITCPCQAQKQEMKCGASKTTEGNGTKVLTCNDECAKLERNRKLAIALNIDQTTHVDGGDHIPYSTETLSFYAERQKWGQTQEREFRVFATSDDEKRMRFKPMRPQERAFVHSLAEDFGFDSESMDPEPHRHVMIWKTPRFVSAPNKTLAEALRIRQIQRSTTVSANVSDNEAAPHKSNASNEVGDPFNSFVISNPRFGLTVDELRAEIADSVRPGGSLPFTFDIEFLPNDEVVLKAIPPSTTTTPHDLQQTLKALRPALAAAVSTKGYGNIRLCTTDSSLNIVRRESDTAAGDGWSRVAAKKAAPRTAAQTLGPRSGNNSFAALTGSKMTFTAKKKIEKVVRQRKEEMEVVDDWEKAELEEEEREKGIVEGGSGVNEVGDESANVVDAGPVGESSGVPQESAQADGATETDTSTSEQLGTEATDNVGIPVSAAEGSAIAGQETAQHDWAEQDEEDLR